MNRKFAYKSYSRRFLKPLRTAHGIWEQREGFIVRIEASGRVGYGEIAPIPDFGTETIEAAAAFLAEWIADPGIANDPVRMAKLPCCAFGISAAMVDVTRPLPDLTVAVLLPAGERALEVLRAKQLGTATERRGDSDLEQDAVAAPLSRGVVGAVYKWKIGVEPLEVELSILEKLLGNLREGERLRLDANGGLDVPSMEAWLAVLSKHSAQIEYLEQPLPVGDEARMAEAMKKSGVPIALDESLNGAEGHRWLKPGAWAGPLVIKPALMGEVTALLSRLKPVADQVVVSSVFETAIGRGNALQLAAQLPGLRYALGLDTLGAFEDGLGEGTVWDELEGPAPSCPVALPVTAFGEHDGAGPSMANLNRDWVEGLSGPEFVARFEACCTELAALDRERGILLAERDPVEFTIVFLAAVSVQVPVILANPNWRVQEWTELASLVNPARIYGMVPFVASKSSVEPLPIGRILIPTGGSSGGVKLAIHTWDSLAASARGLQSFLGGGPIDSCCCLPLYHVSGLMQLVRAVVTEGTICFDDKEPAGKCLSLVPTQLQRILGGTTSACTELVESVSSKTTRQNAVHTEVDPPSRFAQLRQAKVIFVGGAPLSNKLADQAREAELPIVPVYGMTETAAMAVAQSAEQFTSNEYGAQCGHVLPHVNVEVVHDDGTLCETGEVGRIRLSSTALFHGYWGRPKIDLSKGYLTDDEGVLAEGGRLTILGRIDRLILTGGEKVDPREVETALLRCEGVRAALVVGVSDEEWGSRVRAYLVADTDLVQIKAALRPKLAPYKIPKDWCVVDRLPFDEKGKFVSHEIRVE